MENFDVIVVGGGHAGAEAAHAAARMGMETAIFTINADTIGRMPCSPSIGGLAKSHLVKEIDALGGIMAETADATAIQYRLLNTKKGPAVQATRTQNDKWLYEKKIKSRLEKNVHIRQFRVDSLLVDQGRITGVIDQTGQHYGAYAVIITAGTFLSGLIHIGQSTIRAGRAGEEAAYELADSIRKLGLKTGRHKTGTPPRLNINTIDTARMEVQQPQAGLMPLAFNASASDLEQIPCFLTRTSAETHRIIRENITSSPLYSGAITGSPARYCPSLEDKIMRFGERGGHQIIIEPEGLDSIETYASGLGNSMPLELQWKIVRSVPGLEKAEILRPAYAIEYDYILPSQLTRTLETKKIAGLYFAGQVNGTSGYEEAAGQGLLAGINAALKIKGRPPFILDRSRAYIGVMVDDLVTKGTSEPYRMFTSRAEYRLMLRQTNALFRLSDDALRLGLIDEDRHARVNDILHEVADLQDHMEQTSIIIPDQLPGARPKKSAEHEKLSLSTLLKRPETSIADFNEADLLPGASELAIVEAEIEIKYAGYIERQIREIERFRDLEKIIIPPGTDYRIIDSL